MTFYHPLGSLAADAPVGHVQGHSPFGISAYPGFDPWSVRLFHKPRKDHSNTDVLSCLPFPDSPKSVPILGVTVLPMDLLQTLIITAAQIKSWTNHDPVLSKVLTWVASGWSPSTETATEDLRPYTNQ